MRETMPSEMPSEEPPRRTSRAALVGALVVLVIVAAPLLYFALDDGAQSRRSGGDVVDTDPVAAVRAAVGQTMASGSYEMDTVSISTSAPRSMCLPTRIAPGSPPAPTAGVTCATFPGTENRFETHSVVNFEPYAMRSQTQASSLGAITTHINSTHVWQQGGATVGYAPGNPGILITDYASQVLGTIGRGPGALAMLSLASRGGYLNLEEESVTVAQPAGTGTARDVPVTYYEVTIDVKKLAEAPNLSDVQRATIEAAIPMLEQAGYSGTNERIGIDERGYIREVEASTTFADGSSMVRHSFLSNFGCAPKVSMPNEPPAPPTTTPCDPPPVTTAPSTTTSAPPPTTSSTPTTAATPPGTTPPAPTTAPPATTAPPVTPSTAPPSPTTTSP